MLARASVLRVATGRAAYVVLRNVGVRRHSTAAAAELWQSYTTKRDVCVKVLSEGGVLRCSAIQMPNAALEALSRHSIAADTHQAEQLTRVMMLAMLFASFQGGEERVKVDMEVTDAHYAAEATATGETRGRVADSTGTNTLRVSKVLYNQRQPIVSVTPAFSGELVADAKEHIWRSDGVDTALWMKVDLTRHICVGAICQHIPSEAESVGERSELLAEVETAMARTSDDIETAVAEGVHDVAHIAAVLRNVFGGDLTQLCAKTKLVTKEFGGALVGSGGQRVDGGSRPTRIPVDFYCRCSLEGFAMGLSMMGPTELASLKFEQPECPLTCQNCGKVYTMTPEAWQKAFDNAESQ